MRRDTKKLLKLVYLLVLAISPFVAALINTFAGPLSLPAWLFVFTPAYLVWLGKLLYDNSNTVYFHLTRWWLRLKADGVSWSLTVELGGIADHIGVQNVCEEICKLYPSAALWRSAPEEKILKMPLSYMVVVRKVEVQVDAEDFAHKLLIQVPDLVVPFRRGERTLEDIVSLLDSVNRMAKPGDEKYNFRVQFDGPNPYFGLFIRKLRVPDQELVSFNCSFDDRVGHQTERVQVNQERLSLVTHSAMNLLTLSKRYVTLASLDISDSQ